MENGRVSCCMQVCWNIDNPKTADREMRALVKAGAELGCTNLLVITERKEADEVVEWAGKSATVRFIPLWKWLLDK
jgi:hypothetical protein